MNIDPNKIPNHVAMILDGNGRWAKKRFLPRTFGHRKGAFNIVDIAKACSEYGIKYLTMFCFSTENWNRPESEVTYIMNAPIRYYKRYKEKILNSQMKICFIGRRDRIPSALLEIMEEIEAATKDYTKITLTLCIDYGSYDEITTATKEIASLVLEGKLKIEDITKETLENHLFTRDYPKLDLLIRTSGEVRISNYLLWQLGYAELYFTDTLWPDFDKKELEKALLNYQSRNRRFGGLDENK
ncbi:MAG: isoprenyl transferase [Anaeroplasmataceae bacterium]|nr:isoprenyl transferase [Anaeroplasmataceae bacterium]